MARSGNKGMTTQRVGKAEKKTVTRKSGVIRKNLVPERERHLKIRFKEKRGNCAKNMSVGVIPENVRVTLNKTLKSLNMDAYFAKVGMNK